MKPISVLFYIEPVSYRYKPQEAMAYVGWIPPLIAAQPANENISFAFASSPVLCRGFQEQMGEKDYREFVIDPRKFLEPFAFDRHAYGRDLYGRPGNVKNNDALVKFFQDIDRDFSPDIVICFTQNRYIESIFGKRRTLFLEMGQMPRAGGGVSFYLDPRGHQVNNLLNTEIDRILSLPVHNTVTEYLLASWDRLVMTSAKIRTQDSPIPAWLEEKRQGRSVALFAMQPPDWLTYEAAYDNLTLDAVMMRWLNDLPSSWMAIATYHPFFRMPEAAEAMLSELCPAFHILPTELHGTTGTPSEDLIPYIDGIVTISSAAAMIGLLSGKRGIASGLSYMNGLCGKDVGHIDDARILTDQEKAAILMFLSNFYCQTTRDVTTTPGYFSKMIRRFLCASDPLEPYFDFSDWTPANLEKLMIA